MGQQSTSTGRRIRKPVAALFALALVAGACGSDDASDETESSEPAADTADTEPDTTDAAGDDGDGDGSDDGDGDGAAAAPGESTQDRAGETIKVGYVNNEGGVISLPEFRIGGEVAIDHINANGGVNGAMIETVLCTNDASPEGAIDCANQMIEADVVIAYTGIDVASEAALQLYIDAGIPYVSSNGWGPAQGNTEGSTILHAASDAFTVGPLAIAQDLGHEKVASIFEVSQAADLFNEATVKPIAENMGIDLDLVSVDPAAPDYAAAVATAQAGSAEMIYGILPEPSCISMVSAARESGFEGTVYAGSCTAFIDVLGPLAVGVYNQGDIFSVGTSSFAPPEIQERLADYAEAMTAAGQAEFIEGFAGAAYGAWQELDIIMETIEGEITAESVQAALSSGNTTEGWFGADLQCGAAPWPTNISNCQAELLVWQVEERDDGTIGRTLVKDFFDAHALSGL